MQTKFTISGFNVDNNLRTSDKNIYAAGDVIEVTDFMGERMHNISLNFTHMEDGAEMPFANFTLNFGEFLGMKNCAYVDTNNCWFSDEILQTGIAEDTGLTNDEYKTNIQKAEEIVEEVAAEVEEDIEDELPDFLEGEDFKVFE